MSVYLFIYLFIYFKPLLFRNSIYQSLSEMCAISELCKSTLTWPWKRDDEHLFYNLNNYFDWAQELNDLGFGGTPKFHWLHD